MEPIRIKKQKQTFKKKENIKAKIKVKSKCKSKNPLPPPSELDPLLMKFQRMKSYFLVIQMIPHVNFFCRFLPSGIFSNEFSTTVKVFFCYLL